MTTGKKTSVLEHLRELRKRLLRSAIAVVITSTVAFVFIDELLEFLKRPALDLDPAPVFIFIEMTEGFVTYMRVALVAGITAAMPFIIYQFLMFIIPALTNRERKAVYTVLPIVTIMFAGGVAFGYIYLIPPATQFLLGVGTEVAEIQPRLSNYINFITRLLLAIGIMFELPVLTTFLARIGVITSKWLADRRKIMIVFSFVLAAFITPTPDAVNQSIVAGTLIVLYEISIWLAKLVQKRRRSVAEDEEEEEDAEETEPADPLTGTDTKS